MSTQLTPPTHSATHVPPAVDIPPAQEEWGDIVTQKRVAREVREAVQTAARTRSLAELAGAGASCLGAVLGRRGTAQHLPSLQRAGLSPSVVHAAARTRVPLLHGARPLELEPRVRQRVTPPPSPAGIEGEDDPGAYEKAQAKARRFDDWADGVPRGAGVTKRV